MTRAIETVAVCGAGGTMGASIAIVAAIAVIPAGAKRRAGT